METPIQIRKNIQHPNQILERHLMPKYTMCRSLHRIQLIAKFRTSDHCLQIETGRYNNILRQQRLCTTCNILEDEYQFFLNCHLKRIDIHLLRYYK
jgi:hypothetical protein